MTYRKKNYNVAVIGCGMFAQAQHIPNILRSRKSTLHTCCDVQEATLLKLKEQYPGIQVVTDYRKAIDDPEVDLILVATSERFRLPILEKAVAAGKPVLMEKPLAASLDEALQMQGIISSSGIPFCVAHNRRCSPAMMDARCIFREHMRSDNAYSWRHRHVAWDQTRQIVEREMGIAVASIRINDDWWSWNPVHLEGENSHIGLLLSEMTHFADMACWFLDSEPVTVSAQSSGILNHAVSIKFKNGNLANITTGANGALLYPKELLEITGNGGMLAVDHMLEVRTAGIANAPARQTYPQLNDRHPHIGTELGFSGWMKKKAAACGKAARSDDPMLQFTAEPDKGHAHMIDAFIDEICGEREPISPLEDALRAMKICLAAVRSLETKRSVALSEL